MNASPSSLAQPSDNPVSAPRPTMHNPASIAGRGMPERGRAPTASPTITAHQISSVPAAIASEGYPPSASEMTTYTTATATRRACFIGNRSFFGIVSANHPDAADFQTMGDARVGTFRFQLDWRNVQPTQGGPYDWSSVDLQFENAAANGIELLPIFYGSPDYASGSHREPPLGSDEDKQAWKDFVAAAVQRYGSGGGLLEGKPDPPPPPPGGWAGWNATNSPHL